MTAVDGGAPPIGFLVIGAYKSGTSTTRAMLDAHPDVFVTAHKEPNFLAFCEPGDDRWPNGAPNPAHPYAVRTSADWAACYRGAEGATVAGEVSPEYLVSPHAAERAATLLPGARLVAVLRNPVDRAFSDYLMYLRNGVERAPFAEALDAQADRYAAGDATGTYLRTGEYAGQLRRWLDHYPAEQLLVLLQEDLRNDADATAVSLLTHLGVRIDVDVSDVEDRMVSGVPTTRVAKYVYAARARLRPVLGGVVPERIRVAVDDRLKGSLARPTMEPADRARLVDHFADDVTALGALIGRDLSHWLALDP